MRNRITQFMVDPSPHVPHGDAARDDSSRQDVVNTLFAALVQRKLAGDMLTFSHRQELFQSASRLGITKFHANLIIAAVQHEQRARTEVASEFGFAASEQARRYRMASILAMGLVIGSIQTLLLIGAWYLMAG